MKAPPSGSRVLFIHARTVFEIAGFLREPYPGFDYFCAFSRWAAFLGHPAESLAIPALLGILAPFPLVSALPE